MTNLEESRNSQQTTLENAQNALEAICRQLESAEALFGALKKELDHPDCPNLMALRLAETGSKVAGNIEEIEVLGNSLDELAAVFRGSAS